MNVRTLARPGSFRDDISTLVNTCDPTELVERLHDLYVSQLAPLRSQVEDQQSESSRVHDAVRRASHVLRQVQNLAAHQTQTIAQQGATLAHQAEVLRGVRKIAQGAFDGQVKADDLAALLTQEITMPHLVDIPLDFFPSAQFRGGVFASHDNQVKVTYTFVGWTNVARQAGGPIQTEPTFLVQDRGALPCSVIETEREMRLQMPLLPNLQAV